jgi:hypothetical protein
VILSHSPQLATLGLEKSPLTIKSAAAKADDAVKRPKAATAPRKKVENIVTGADFRADGQVYGVAIRFARGGI